MNQQKSTFAQDQFIQGPASSKNDMMAQYLNIMKKKAKTETLSAVYHDQFEKLNHT